MELGFWRIAMRPGKPLMHGRLGRDARPRPARQPGLVHRLRPAVPRAAAARAFRRPARGRRLTEAAVLGGDLPDNDTRQDYLRARITGTQDGRSLVDAFGKQDSSMLRVLSEAQCLIVRDAHAPAARAGEMCRMLRV